MKLYATTTSERASKGQGGNEYLDIEIYAFNRDNPVGRISVTTDTDSTDKVKQWIITWQGVYDDDERVILQEGHETEGIIQELREPKGKKEKGESDPICRHGVNLKYDDCHNCDIGEE